MPRTKEPPEPWRSFFAEVDAHFSQDIHLHCCGGFVATQLYGVARTTSDVDFLSVVPNVQRDLIEIAGKGSRLHQTYKVYLDAVTVATPPENYERRLVTMYPGAWVHLRLEALEVHDLALSKLERNSERDRCPCGLSLIGQHNVRAWPLPPFRIPTGPRSHVSRFPVHAENKRPNPSTESPLPPCYPYAG